MKIASNVKIDRILNYFSTKSNNKYQFSIAVYMFGSLGSRMLDVACLSGKKRCNDVWIVDIQTVDEINGVEVASLHAQRCKVGGCRHACADTTKIAGLQHMLI